MNVFVVFNQFDYSGLRVYLHSAGLMWVLLIDDAALGPFKK